MVENIPKKDDSLSEQEVTLLLQRCKSVLQHYPLMQKQFNNVSEQFPNKTQGYATTIYEQVRKIGATPDDKKYKPR